MTPQVEIILLIICTGMILFLLATIGSLIKRLILKEDILKIQQKRIDEYVIMKLAMEDTIEFQKLIIKELEQSDPLDKIFNPVK
jgi:hypothetical protein